MLDEKPSAAKLANVDTNAQNGCTQNVSSIASENHSVDHICCSCDVDDQEARTAAPDFFWGVIIHVIVVLDSHFDECRVLLVNLILFDLNWHDRCH